MFDMCMQDKHQSPPKNFTSGTIWGGIAQPLHQNSDLIVQGNFADLQIVICEGEEMQLEGQKSADMRYAWRYRRI